jgi:hypothetical protein
MRHAWTMDSAESDRLRRAICRSFSSQPHKKKYWLALLEMYSTPGGEEMSGRNPSRNVYLSTINSAGGKNLDSDA